VERREGREGREGGEGRGGEKKKGKERLAIPILVCFRRRYPHTNL